MANPKAVVALQGRLGEIDDEVRKIDEAVDKREKPLPTAEEMTKLRALKEEREQAEKDLDFLQKELAELTRKAAANASKDPLPANPSTTDVRVAPRVETPRERERRTFRGLGEQMLAVFQASAPNIDPKVRERAINKLMENEKRAPTGLSTLVESDGAYLLQDDVSQNIQELAWDSGVLSSQCTTIPLSQNAQVFKQLILKEDSRANGSRFGGVTVQFVNEAEAASPSKPGLKVLEIGIHKMMGMFYATSESLNDTAAMGNIAARGLTEEMAFVLDDRIMRGSGVNEPKGILTSSALIKVPKESGQTRSSTPVTAKNLLAMRKRISPRSRAKGRWYYNIDLDDAIPTVYLPTGTNSGQLLLTPAGGLTQQPYDTIFGRPLVPCEVSEAGGTVGDLMFLDLDFYSLVTKGGIQSDSSMHVAFLTDQMAFRFIWRIGGAPVLEVPVAPYKGTTTTSPFVALDIV